MNKNSLTIKTLTIIGALIGFFMAFCTIAPATVLKGLEGTSSNGARMINWMLARNVPLKVPGMQALLVFEIILALSCLILIILFVSKTLTKKRLTVLGIIISVTLLVCIILSFLTVKFVCSASINDVKDKLTPAEMEQFMNRINHTHNGTGPISYSICGIISFICITLANIFNNIKTKEQNI